MRLIGPAPHADGDRAAAGAAILRIIGIGLNPDLGDRIGRRHERQRVAATAFVVGVWRPVEQKFIRSHAAAVNGQVIHPAVVEGSQLDALTVSGFPDHAGRDLRERERIAAGHRQVLDFFLIDHGASRRARRLQQRRFRHHLDLLGDGADHERLIDLESIAGANLQFSNRRGEAREREREPIRADLQRAQQVGAGFVRGRSGRDVGRKMERCDGDTRQRAALRVLQRARDRTPCFLPVGRTHADNTGR